MSGIGNLINSMINPSSGAGFEATTSGASQAQQDQAYQNTQAALKQQQDFVNSLNAQNGISNQSSVFNQQQALANQLGNLSQGIGPNPAQAQLAQNTAANTANQAALMAGQRGAAQNPALIARQAAQQGAANQQGAVGQAATLQAQQQIAAMQALQGQQANMAGLAGSQVGEQQNALNAYNQTALGQQGNLLGAQANQNATNAQIAGINTAGQQHILGGLFNAAGLGGATASGGAAKAEGGEIEDESDSAPNPAQIIEQNVSGPKSMLGQFLSGLGSVPMLMAAKGGTVPALVSPGEQRIPKDEVKDVADGKKNPLKTGERFPGSPKHPGNDYRNDIIKRDLPVGDVIIPNEIMQSKDAEKKAIAFVRDIVAKNRLK